MIKLSKDISTGGTVVLDFFLFYLKLKKKMCAKSSLKNENNVDVHCIFRRLVLQHHADM